MAALVFSWRSPHGADVSADVVAGSTTLATRMPSRPAFNFTLGAASFALQLLVTGPALRRFGIAVTVLILPLSLGLGTSLIWRCQAGSCLQTGPGFQFSVDKATTTAVPIARSETRGQNAIDIIFNRIADGCGALLLGLATGGFM
jgi:hypothetical protein